MTKSKESDFSLAWEPWILVQRHDDAVETVSIRDAIVRAIEFRRLLGDIPTQAFAILRVLEAVLHRAVEGPTDDGDWLSLRTEGPPVEAVEVYLRRWEHRFWLFDNAEPFFQVADLHTTKNAMTGLERIIADVPPKDPFFTVRLGEQLDRITPAEAARWLVHCHAFDVSGIKTGAVGDDRVSGGRGYPIGVAWAGNLGGLIIEGASLWETLLFNLIPEDADIERDPSEDLPAWERDQLPGSAQDPQIDERPYGPLDLYTWQSRRVRLQGDRHGVTGALVCNGDRLKPQNRLRSEPMTSWRRSIPQEKALKTSPVYMPREHRLDRALWRGIGAILPASSPRSGSAGSEPEPAVTSAMLDWLETIMSRNPEQFPTNSLRLSVRATGLAYGSQSAVLLGVIDDAVDLDARLLLESEEGRAQLAARAVDMAEEGVSTLMYLAANLERAAGAVDKSGGDGARASAAARAYYELGGHYQRWLLALPEMDVARALVEWQQTANQCIRSLGRQLVNEAGPAAMVGRVVQRGGREAHISAAEADLIFSGRLTKIFPHAYSHITAKESA